MMRVLYLGHKLPFDTTNVAVKLPYLRVLLNDAFTIAMGGGGGSLDSPRESKPISESISHYCALMDGKKTD